jgi:uroporphyrinogen decarboxylase
MAAVEHRTPDRVPRSYYGTAEMNQKLITHLGLNSYEELLRYLKTDIREVAGRYVGPKEYSGAPGIRAVGTDIWGVEWKPVKNEFGTYNEIAHHPLASARTVKDVEAYHWPNPDWFDFSHLKEEIKRLNDKERYAVKFFVGGGFESPWYMRGLEQFLLDLIECPELAAAICRHVVGFYKERAMRALEAAAGMIDILGSGGDIGAQKGMMLSPGLWRERIKPWSRELIRPFKDMGLKTFYHSCGSIVPVIEDLIEIGVDILDPVQPRAEGMELESLKKAFGDRLTFHGGVDEQELLPFGTPADVEKEVERLLGVFNRNGGYILCPAHAVQPDTPIENLLAMYRKAGE